MTKDTRGRAREFRALSGPEAIRAHTGVSDTDYAYVCAVGEAQEIIGDLLAIIARLLDGPGLVCPGCGSPGVRLPDLLCPACAEAVAGEAGDGG